MTFHFIAVKHWVSRYLGILIFLISLVVILSALWIPLLQKGKTLINANHLVAFYNPWVSTSGSGWGLTVHQKPVGQDDLFDLLSTAYVYHGGNPEIRRNSVLESV